jgi:hypothetical protein
MKLSETHLNRDDLTPEQPEFFILKLIEFWKYISFVVYFGAQILLIT